NSYTVTFNSNGGSAVTSQTIEYGGLIAQPSNPTKTGYTFSGWYKESTFTNLWGFNVDTVNSDKTLYAKFTDALWAKSVTAGNDTSSFSSVAVDSSGNIYAAGLQKGAGSYTYGAGVSVAGTYADINGSNVVLVKYNSSGAALWAKSVTAGTDWSGFYSVAVDSSGNVYAAGYQRGTGSYTYGPGVSVAGTYSAYNVVLVKYNSSGTALWAKSVTAGNNRSQFNSVAVDSSGNVYAAGCQYGTGSYTYGEGVSVAGSYSDSDNVVLVKYGATP
ncbi:MAG TPA: InlB B-repeat-containing protein, partial [Spirochaetota bacterium]|nr:InlB B-repeat-containing protein [Spirochaetota bacterium]